MKSVFIFISLLVFHFESFAQANYTVANAHSHNDYLQQYPFTAAFKAGFGSIEADIFPVGSKLLVAHSAKEIDQSRTLHRLYLKPLKSALKNQQTELQLLIDIKAETKTAMDLLVKQLQPLRRHLSTPEEKKQLKIVMTGKIPLPENYVDYPDFIFYDHDLKHQLNKAQWRRVGMVSVNFKTYSKWKGGESPAVNDLDRLAQVIKDAHSQNKAFRFWGMPDHSESWRLQQSLKVDWIGTDHIDRLRNFLKAGTDHNPMQP